MTKEKQEHLILQIKYAFLALIVGICVGIVDTVFGRGLLAISAFRTAHYQFLLPFLPLTGLLIIWLYQHFSSLSLKGMSLIFETGQKKREEIPLALVPLVMICTWITHLFGGSAGREGVAVQIGATISHEAGRRLHRKNTGHAHHRYGSRIRRLIPNPAGGCIFCYGSDCCRIYGV